MKLEDLEPLLAKVRLVGPMPTPSLHMKSDCKESKGTWRKKTWAHAHGQFGIRHKGWICFSPQGLDRPDDKVIYTLAHELAHLRLPKRAHRSRAFQEATEEFNRVFNG